MTTRTETTRLAAPIDELLAGLRRRIRRYVWIEGVALVLAALGVAFWFSLAVDYSFEPPTAIRVILLLLYASAAMYVISHMIVARLRMPLSDRSMAILLERQFAHFGDRLVTAVEMTEPTDGAAEMTGEMLDYTRDKAIDQLGQVELEKIFNPLPLARGVIAGVVLSVSVLAFQTTMPDAFGLWIRRSVLLSNELWPRTTRLVLEGFATQFGIVADDSQTELHVFAGNVRIDRDRPARETSQLGANQARRLSIALDAVEGELSDADERRFARHFAPASLSGATQPQAPRAASQESVDSDEAVGVATLSYTKDCTWSDQTLPVETGGRVSAGTLHLIKGLAELSFDSGARIVMEGPSVVEIDTDDRIRLTSGKVLASVPRQAKGFRVDTPAARLTDQGNDETTIAKGSDLPLFVNADTEKVVPRVVEVRFETAEGGRERRRMQREGNAQRGKDKQQRYAHTFARVNAPIDFDVVGGDDRLRDLRIDVVDSPTLIEPVLECEYPSYMGRASDQLPVTGAMLIPYGTHVVYRATATKELLGVRIDEQSGEDVRVTHELHFTEDTIDARRVEFDLGPLKEERTLLFQLLDMDGITNGDLIRLLLTPAEDDAPLVDVRTRGIGSAITAKARIPFVGQIDDDYGISRCWFEYNTDGQPVRETNLSENPEGTVVQQVNERFDVSPLELKPGQKLTLSIKAQDNFDLAEAPNVGRGERLVMDIVSDEQLRARLEARELNLRRRFESIIEEVTDTHDSLARVLLGLKIVSATEQDADEESDTAEKAGTQTGNVDEAEPAGDNETPEVDDEESAKENDEDRDHEETSRAIALDQLRIQRAVQSSLKNAEEIVGVKTSFEDILEELINNGIDSDELRARLRDGIADPLGRIVDDDFSALDKLLTQLQSEMNRVAKLHRGVKTDETDTDDLIAAVEGARDVLTASRIQSDAILVNMQAVLEKMLELETFNEVLDLIRGIIESQEEVNEATKQRRKQKLRELLED